MIKRDQSDLLGSLQFDFDAHVQQPGSQVREVPNQIHNQESIEEESQAVEDISRNVEMDEGLRP